ncbi:translation initiation factor IF-6 [Candidatus Nanohalococcus occultus]|uniref:Translation initiation factor 6 n=1 Tax=Candidatus Nanohalococcus occultus TaxID=2978047 RepID=A0ABY8CDW7_9ARCH|nr:Translation initiation factor 6 (eIF-6) [Candidatus Nanohaloarchaeota archaeon SVXNc]
MIERYNYEGEPTVGFAATVTPEYAIYPPEFKRKDFFEAKSVETFITRTKLPGLFTAGNSNCILVPEGLSNIEQKKMEESEVAFEVINSRRNALGNMILANDKGALISPRLEEVKDEIEDALEVPVKIGTIAGIPNPGVAAAANNKGALLHREATEEDAELVSEVLDVERVDIGSINMGSPYIGSGMICDDENVLVGEESTGPEIGRIDRTLHVEEQ